MAVSTPTGRPYVTYTLLVINTLLFLLQSASEALYGFDLVASMGMKVNELIMLGEYWRLFTPMFLHGSILHLGFNMYALYIFGPGLERYYRHGRFLLLFFLGGFAGNVSLQSGPPLRPRCAANPDHAPAIVNPSTSRLGTTRDR